MYNISMPFKFGELLGSCCSISIICTQFSWRHRSSTKCIFIIWSPYYRLNEPTQLWDDTRLGRRGTGNKRGGVIGYPTRIALQAYFVYAPGTTTRWVHSVCTAFELMRMGQMKWDMAGKRHGVDRKEEGWRLGKDNTTHVALCSQIKASKHSVAVKHSITSTN